jgi:3'-phosphoadenosine 5'-phosphosulfate sulfotransferase (PAPS reductase)/FAD synthetase
MSTAFSSRRAALRRHAPARSRDPVVLAYGMGVDSTALLLELHSRKEPPDLVLTADTGVEKPETYAYQTMMTAWMAARGIAYEVVRYVPRRFKHWPPYYDLLSNVLTNATLPSISLGRHSCSLGPATKSVLSPRGCAVMFQADRRAYPKSWRWSA